MVKNKTICLSDKMCDLLKKEDNASAIIESLLQAKYRSSKLENLPIETLQLIAEINKKGKILSAKEIQLKKELTLVQADIQELIDKKRELENG
jgi:hypothetical protein